MKYLSVCSGIEAATVAWHPLGWNPVGFSEIDPFAREVLTHCYPQIPLHGDFTALTEKDYGKIDLLVGGTPCQSFSVSGLRKGIDDDRGKLTLEFIRLAQRARPRWLVWENVPGVLSIDGGRTFGSILGGLAECGYGFAYRILDAQHFGVPQRRRRVFIVGYLGDWRRAAAVLFERDSLRGDITPSRKKGEGNSGAFETSRDGGRIKDISSTVSCKWAKGSGGPAGDECQNLVAIAHAVRRLTPLECERLQGFPDNYTLVPYRGKLAADGNRYKVLGNSMAVPVMRWIGDRIKTIAQFSTLF